MMRRPPSSPLFPYPPLFRSRPRGARCASWRRREQQILRSRASRALAQDDNAARLRGGREGGLSLPLTKRSEEHTSELQSQSNIVCRLLLENNNKYGANVPIS